MCGKTLRFLRYKKEIRDAEHVGHFLKRLDSRFGDSLFHFSNLRMLCILSVYSYCVLKNMRDIISRHILRVWTLCTMYLLWNKAYESRIERFLTFWTHPPGLLLHLLLLQFLKVIFYWMIAEVSSAQLAWECPENCNNGKLLSIPAAARAPDEFHFFPLQNSDWGKRN